MSKNVYIVHCVDTEGPLYESLSELFLRLQNAYGIEIEPSLEKLELLQKKKIPLNGMEDAVATFLEPNRLLTNETWHEIDIMLDKILRDDFRNKLLDSRGSGWRYSWFCVDHAGFTGKNPRRRDMGFNNIYDHYVDILKKYSCQDKDTVQFHYHPLPFNGDCNMCATAYLTSNNIYEILARKIIDRHFFPCANRPGFHTERPDSHWFLEQWIPFDYANQAVKNEYKENQTDIGGGRYGDWRRAPLTWVPYHPAHNDYQKIGGCNRYIMRCLNMNARVRQITQDDVLQAFAEAAEGQDVILSFTNHDFRDMEREIEPIRTLIEEAAKEYKDVNFYFMNAVEAMQNYLERNCEEKDIADSLDFDIRFSGSKDIIKMEVTSNKRIFGPQPFLALKTMAEKYYWDNFDFQSETSWSYTFDINNFYLRDLRKIGIAANTAFGETRVKVYDVEKNEITSICTE